MLVLAFSIVLYQYTILSKLLIFNLMSQLKNKTHYPNNINNVTCIFKIPINSCKVLIVSIFTFSCILSDNFIKKGFY